MRSREQYSGAVARGQGGPDGLGVATFEVQGLEVHPGDNGAAQVSIWKVRDVSLPCCLVGREELNSPFLH